MINTHFRGQSQKQAHLVDAALLGWLDKPLVRLDCRHHAILPHRPVSLREKRPSPKYKRGDSLEGLLGAELLDPRRAADKGGNASAHPCPRLVIAKQQTVQGWAGYNYSYAPKK